MCINCITEKRSETFLKHSCYLNKLLILWWWPSLLWNQINKVLWWKTINKGLKIFEEMIIELSCLITSNSALPVSWMVSYKNLYLLINMPMYIQSIVALLTRIAWTYTLLLQRLSYHLRYKANWKLFDASWCSLISRY